MTEKVERTQRTEKFNVSLDKQEVITAIQEYLRVHYGDEAEDIRISTPDTLPVYYNKVMK